MKLDGADKAKLRELYEHQLQQCEKVPVSWGPARHRAVQIDTDRTLQGTSTYCDIPLLSRPAAVSTASPDRTLLTANRTSPAGTAVACKGSSKRAASGRQAVQTIKAAELEPIPASLYKTDYCRDGSEQQRLSQLTATRRELQAGSEWALLDQLEHTIAKQEVAVRQAVKQHVQQQQKQLLDLQVAEHEQARQEAHAAKAADLAAATAYVEAHKAEIAAKEAATQAAAFKLKADREKQVVHISDPAETRASLPAAAGADTQLRLLQPGKQAAAEVARKRQAAKKTHEEAALLASIQKQMDQAKAAAEAKAAATKAEAEAAKKANMDAQEAKKIAVMEQHRKDEELMRETIRTLEKQEEAREAALKAFHENIAARAVNAGAAAVAENRSRQEREERLIAASEAKAKAEAEAKHAAEVAKRSAMAADRKVAAAAAAAAKAAAEQAGAREKARIRAEMEADLHLFQQSATMTAEHRKQRNMQNRAALELQIAEAEARQLLDDVFMVDREKELNVKLITTARGMMARMELQ